MISYVLEGAESLALVEWKLTEFVPGEDPEVIARAASLSPSEVIEWANAQIGPYVELDWKSADGSVLSLKWTSQRPEPGDDPDLEVFI